eukprot:gene23789-9350_t
MSGSTSAPALESEMHWDRLIDLSLRRFTYGTLAGGAVALTFFRGPKTRTALISLFAGAGLGSAWQQYSSEFEELLSPGLKK